MLPHDSTPDFCGIGMLEKLCHRTLFCSDHLLLWLNILSNSGSNFEPSQSIQMALTVHEDFHNETDASQLELTQF